MLRLRERTAADRDAVVSWIPDAAALYLFTGPRLQWPLDADQLASMESSDLSAWMLVESGEPRHPLGHFDLTINGSSARLGRVLIDPACRGRGLARVLVSLAVDQAQVLGAAELRLNVIAGNEPAVRTYLSAGFTELPESERPDVVAMRLAL